MILIHMNDFKWRIKQAKKLKLKKGKLIIKNQSTKTIVKSVHSITRRACLVDMARSKENTWMYLQLNLCTPVVHQESFVNFTYLQSWPWYTLKGVMYINTCAMYRKFEKNHKIEPSRTNLESELMMTQMYFHHCMSHIRNRLHLYARNK
jgi:hypothetical protein